MELRRDFREEQRRLAAEAAARAARLAAPRNRKIGAPGAAMPWEAGRKPSGAASSAAPSRRPAAHAPRWDAEALGGRQCACRVSDHLGSGWLGV